MTTHEREVKVWMMVRLMDDNKKKTKRLEEEKSKGIFFYEVGTRHNFQFVCGGKKTHVGWPHRPKFKY